MQHQLDMDLCWHENPAAKALHGLLPQHKACADLKGALLVALQTALGAMFATYNVRADRLTVLKTSFPEELILTGRAPAGAPKVISMVAFR